MRTVGRALLATAVLAVLVAGGFGGALADGPSPADAVGDVADHPAGATAPSDGATAPTGESSHQPTRPGADAAAGGDGTASAAGPTGANRARTGSTAAGATAAGSGTVDAGEGAAVDGTAATEATAGQSERADVTLEQEYRLTPDRPGNVSVTYRYALADRMVTLQTQVPERATVVNADGFDARNATTYAWDGDTADPSITYALPVNETGSRSHAAVNGSLLFADAGDWALFRRPPTGTYWEALGRDRVTFDREIRTVGPGAAGDWLVFLGPVELHARTAENQTFRLAVPAAANVTESPADVLAAMERASADLDVGDRDESVFAVAAPTDGVPWAVRGLSTGDSDFWVGADERLDTTDNIWIHEYVHTRQAYGATPATQWTTEGFASYFAARHALEYQPVTFEEFAASLAISPDSPANVTLANPDTWRNVTAYERGAAVAAQIDRRVRLATGGERSLESVLAEMNADRDRVNATELFAIVGAAGGDGVREYAVDAVTADRSPSTWNRSQHVAAFGGLPAHFSYGLAPPDGADRFRVTGPFRNASLDGDGRVTISTGETLVANARVANVGDAPGYFEASLTVNGTVVDVADGRMAGNGSRIVPLTHAFDDPGAYSVGVGNDTATVVVRRPANASIVGFTLRQRSIPQYGTATVDVTVRNDADVPARRIVSIRRDDTVVNRSVSLGPNATETTSVPIRFPAAGSSEVAVRDAGAVEVEVSPREMPPPTPTPTVVRPPTATPTATVTDGPAETPPDAGTQPGDGAGTAVAVGASAAVLVLASAMAVARLRE